MRKFILNVVFYIVIAIVLGTKDIFIDTWQYWVIAVMVLGLELNNSFN